MNVERAIEALEMENALMQFDPNTGEDYPIELQNQDNQDLYKANLIAISALEKQLNGGWIQFEAEYDEDLKMDMLQGHLPDDEQEIIVTNGKTVWIDTFMRDGIECYLDSGDGLGGEVIAWMPLPEPYKED